MLFCWLSFFTAWIKTSVASSFYCGVAQGSILGPVLFSVYFLPKDHITQSLNHNQAHVLLKDISTCTVVYIRGSTSPPAISGKPTCWTTAGDGQWGIDTKGSAVAVVVTAIAVWFLGCQCWLLWCWNMSTTIGCIALLRLTLVVLNKISQLVDCHEIWFRHSWSHHYEFSGFI